jgi:hypothetical protein
MSPNRVLDGGNFVGWNKREHQRATETLRNTTLVADDQFAVVLRSIEFELFEVSFAVGFGHLFRLLLFEQDMPTENQDVHPRHQEAVPGVFRRADNGLAANIEAGVDQNRTAGLFFEA